MSFDQLGGLVLSLDDILAAESPFFQPEEGAQQQIHIMHHNTHIQHIILYPNDERVHTTWDFEGEMNSAFEILANAEPMH